MCVHCGARLVFILLAIVVILVTGCGYVYPQRFKHIETLQRGNTVPSVLLMPMDVELGTVTAAGILEPNAEWTANAEKNIRSALTEILRDRGVKLVEYEASAVDPKLREEHIQLIKLHQVIGSKLYRIDMLSDGSLHLGQNQCPDLCPENLPTQKDRLEWSLGPTVTTLREAYNADYALFLFVRDSYASTGRLTLIIISGLMGNSLTGGMQKGFASLVDLHSGKIVWFNQMLRQLEGDLRTPDKAQESVVALLETFPK